MLSFVTNQRMKKNRIGEEKDRRSETTYQQRPTRHQAEILRRKITHVGA